MAAMTGPSMRDRLNRLQDELEARLPDGKTLLGVDDGLASMSPVDAQAFEGLKQEMKRKKFLHLSVEAHLAFISGVQQGHLQDADARSKELESAKGQAKEKNKDLKQEVEQVLQEHANLYKQRAEAYRELERQREECQRMMRELRDLVQEEEEAEAELAGDEGMGGHSLNSSVDDLEALPNHLAEKSDEMGKRRKLEYEKRDLERQQRIAEEMRADFAQLQAQEDRELERLEALEKLQCDIGLPRLHLDEANGRVLLGSPVMPGERPEEVAIRTVQVKYDSSGHLVKAEPHPSLGLWNEATCCVSDNDLARLITLVWDRLCEQQSRGQPEFAQLGA